MSRDWKIIRRDGDGRTTVHSIDLRKGPRHDVPSFLERSDNRQRLARSPGKFRIFTAALAFVAGAIHANRRPLRAVWSIAAGVIGSWLVGSGIMWSLDPSDWGFEVRATVILFLAPAIAGLAWLAGGEGR